MNRRSDAAGLSLRAAGARAVALNRRDLIVSSREAAAPGRGCRDYSTTAAGRDACSGRSPPMANPLPLLHFRLGLARGSAIMFPRLQEEARPPLPSTFPPRGPCCSSRSETKSSIPIKDSGWSSESRPGPSWVRTCGFYSLRMASSDTTVLVPVDNVEDVGLRRAIGDHEVKKLFGLLGNGKIDNHQTGKGASRTTPTRCGRVRFMTSSMC